MKKNINKILIVLLMIFSLSVSTLTIVEAKSSKSAITEKTQSKKGKKAKKIKIPDFNNVPNIKDWCKKNKLKLKTKYKYSNKVEKGKIISQKPKVGKKVKKNAKVNVVISKGRKSTMEEKKNKNSSKNDISFVVSDVRNDVTGNWRIAKIAENIEIQDYALNYYKKYFKNDNEIHAIVNFNYKTTTKISVMGNLLDVTIYEYVDKEEHDANLLFSGMLLKEYHVNKDTGEIEEIQ